MGGTRIEARDRLVGKDDPRLLGQDARDRDALLLAAGELVGTLIGFVEKPDMIERGKRELPVGGG